MNSTVKLVNAWAAYEEQHPGAQLEDFCRYHLTQEREADADRRRPLFGGDPMPPSPHLVLGKLMGHLTKLYSFYVSLAIKHVGIRREEDFYFLNYIRRLQNPRKTEVIYAYFMELTTGLSILNGLKESGLIEEVDDPDDKRSKRVSLTPAGEQVLFDCYKQFSKVGNMLFKEMPEEDSRLCIQLLQGIEGKFSTLWQHHRGRDFEELYREMMGDTAEGSGK
jgi:DNA-binding MarR family transcriptional regulator